MFDAITANIIKHWNKNHMGLNDSLPPIQDNGRTAFEYFISQGLSPHQAAGIVGNLQGESGQGLNTNAINRGDGRDGSDSVGIAQWNGERAAALKAYAAAKGTPWNDLTTQLEFLHRELQGPESAAYGRLMAARTPEEAGQAMLAFERPKDWNVPGAHPERGQYAARVFSTYGGGLPATRAGPLNAIPQPTAPMFAQPPQPQQQPQMAQPQPEPAGFDQIPMGPAPPIFFPRPKQIDLSKLMAAFKQPNFYGRA